LADAERPQVDEQALRQFNDTYQRLKPPLKNRPVPARLKPGPFKTRHKLKFFRSL
jgi:hypothetical protein